MRLRIVDATGDTPREGVATFRDGGREIAGFEYFEDPVEEEGEKGKEKPSEYGLTLRLEKDSILVQRNSKPSDRNTDELRAMMEQAEKDGKLHVSLLHTHTIVSILT